MGIAMVFYALLSAFSTIPVVLLYAKLGLPVGVNFNTLQVYGTQLSLLLVNFTTTVIRLGVPTLFLAGTLRRYVNYSSFSAPRLRTVPLSVPIVLGGAVVASFAATLLQNTLALFGYRVSAPNYSIPSEPLEFILTMLSLTLVPAVLEELLFRGAILQGLRRLGDGIALLVSSLLFALAHFNAVQAANAFIMGLLIGYFVLRTGSVWTGMILHFVVNLVSFWQVVLFRAVLPENSELISNVFSLVLLAAGILAFLAYVRKESTAFSIPLPKKGLVSTPKRMALCFGNLPMLLALFMLLAQGING